MNNELNLKKVYLVSSGRYSDYSILAVFSTREKAEELNGHFGVYANDIEEFLLDPDIVYSKKQRFSVTITRDGDTEKLERIEDMKYTWDSNSFVYGTPVFGGNILRKIVK